MSIIEAITKDCPREDCRISMDSCGWTTLIGWAPVYDKSGKQLNHDPNKTNTGARCSACCKSWAVTTQAGETPKIKELERS